MKLTMLVALMAAVLPGAGVPWLPSMTYGLWKQEAPGAINLREVALRGAATVRPMPEFPQASFERKTTGVAVAAVSIGLVGRVDKVEILDAPDSHIAAAVREAVTRWIVPWQAGPAGETAKPRTGKLTFYFRIVGGSGRVFNPEDLPGGPRFAVQAHSAAVPAVRGSGSPSGTPAAAAATPVKTISVADMQKLAEAVRPIVLDIGARDAFKRGHWPGAVNIPVDELPVRAGIELAGAKAVAIDCTREEIWRCQAGASTLRQQGLTELMIVVP